MVDVVHQGGQGVVGEASHEDKWVWVGFSLQEVLEEEARGGEDKSMSLNALTIFTHMVTSEKSCVFRRFR